MNEDRMTLYNLARRAAWVTGAFAFILSLLMIANYLQTRSVDPMNSQAIARLMEQLREDPGDETLKEQIRALDLLARRAYFTTQWQLRTGSYLLFAFVLVLIASLKYMSSFRSTVPDLRREAVPEDSPENKLLSKKYLVYSGMGLVVLALLFGFLSQSELKNLGLEKGESGEGSTAGPTLEEIRANWPSFRGPEGLGIAYHTDVPRDWDGASGRNILWKVSNPLPGYNSPIIWGDRIFFSGANRETQQVFCLDADSGETLWSHALDDIPGSPERRPRISEDTGFAAPTMASDGLRVFAAFATGDVAGLDFEGKRVWARNLGMPDNHYGHSSSLIVYQDLLIVPYDQNTGGRLLALSTATGDVVYDVPREVEISWGSPILVNTGKRFELILNANPFVMAHDPRTGRELWRVKCMLGEVAPSPAYWDGMVFAVNDYARLVGIRLGDTPEVSWEYIDDLSEVSSPLAAGGFVLMAASYGTVSCFDAGTGERHWFEDFDEGFYSSPILVGDTVYLMDVQGVTHIFKLADEFETAGRAELGEPAMTIPAFMHNRIYIRGVENIYCIGK